jgi:transposase InsO family protein
LRFVEAENDLVGELTQVMGSQRRALALVGLSRSTWYYRSHPRPPVTEPVPHKDRAYPTRISQADRQEIIEWIGAGWKDNHSVDHSFATAWDQGVMLGSRRSWWRIAARITDQSDRPKLPTRRHTKDRTPRPAPVLIATSPTQVWSWDITDLPTPWRGVAFKAYCIIDIYSRKIVGYRVEERETDHLAVEMFTQAIAREGAPHYVHADSGPAMRSNALKDYLTSHDITLTHNRPRVSNDNPYSESEFRTMKYRPHYPGTFTTLHDAQTFLEAYVTWYNNHHKHSALALFTPNQVHDGTWQHPWTTRHQALQAYYNTHPQRFHHPPTTPTPPTTTGINHPTPPTQNTHQ